MTPMDELLASPDNESSSSLLVLSMVLSMMLEDRGSVGKVISSPPDNSVSEFSQKL
jgi:hypothetical protein